MIVTNAFSANMLVELPASVAFAEISAEQVGSLLRAIDGVQSAVGHPDTAAVFTTVLGIEVVVNRRTIALKKGDQIVVGQYRGPRLPEGATTLPEGATIQWLLVSVL